MFPRDEEGCVLAPNFEGLAHRGPTRGVVIVVEIPPSLPNEPRWRHRKETRPTREDAKEILIVAEILLSVVFES